jgi:acyl dehydratase
MSRRTPTAEECNAIAFTWNKIRFPAPVPVDSKVRGKAEVISVDEVGGGWWQAVRAFSD